MSEIPRDISLRTARRFLAAAERAILLYPDDKRTRSTYEYWNRIVARLESKPDSPINEETP